MGFFDSISDTFDKVKHKTSSFIDTGSDRLSDTVSFPSRIIRSSASTFDDGWDDAKDFVKKTKDKVASTARNEWDDTKDFVKKTKKDDAKDLAKKTKKKIASIVENKWDDAKRGTTLVKDRAIDWVKNNTELERPSIDFQSVEERDRHLRQNLQRFWKTPLGDRMSQPPVIEGP
jgi:hypothetical protein